MRELQIVQLFKRFLFSDRFQPVLLAIVLLQYLAHLFTSYEQSVMTLDLHKTGKGSYIMILVDVHNVMKLL